MRHITYRFRNEVWGFKCARAHTHTHTHTHTRTHTHIHTYTHTHTHTHIHTHTHLQPPDLQAPKYARHLSPRLLWPGWAKKQCCQTAALHTIRQGYLAILIFQYTFVWGYYASKAIMLVNQVVSRQKELTFCLPHALSFSSILPLSFILKNKPVGRNRGSCARCFSSK